MSILPFTGQIPAPKVPKKGLPCAAIRFKEDAAGREWWMHIIQRDRTVCALYRGPECSRPVSIFFKDEDAAWYWLNSFSGPIAPELGKVAA